MIYIYMCVCVIGMRLVREWERQKERERERGQPIPFVLHPPHLFLSIQDHVVVGNRHGPHLLGTSWRFIRNECLRVPTGSEAVRAYHQQTVPGGVRERERENERERERASGGHIKQARWYTKLDSKQEDLEQKESQLLDSYQDLLDSSNVNVEVSGYVVVVVGV